jgi:hypothetical protein
MSTVTVRINSKSKKGKHILAILTDMAKFGNDIELEYIPNAETIKALEDAHNKIGYKAINIDDLLKQLEA